MNDLAERTKRFAINVIRFCENIPSTTAHRVIVKQLIRSASSVGANYRATQRARSKIDFIAKLGIVEEEADESLYWLELLEALGMNGNDGLERLKNEADQLVSIIVSSKKKLRPSPFEVGA
jgi:four helix bundle protein